MVIREEILEELLKDYKNPEDLIGKNVFLEDLTKHKAKQNERFTLFF